MLSLSLSILLANERLSMQLVGEFTKQTCNTMRINNIPFCHTSEKMNLRLFVCVYVCTSMSHGFSADGFLIETQKNNLRAAVTATATNLDTGYT